MDESIRYNLRNPAFSEDICTSQINRMFPCVQDSGYNISGMPTGVNFNNGQPTTDKYQPRSQKDKALIKKLLIGAGILALGGFAFGTVKGLFSSAKTILEKGFGGLKGKITSSGSKIKGFFGKIIKKFKK